MEPIELVSLTWSGLAAAVEIAIGEGYAPPVGYTKCCGMPTTYSALLNGTAASPSPGAKDRVIQKLSGSGIKVD